MADVHTKKQRAKNMAAIKSKGNKSTEAKFLAFLKTNKITGWRRNYKSVKGKPDFVFPKARTAIFLDGCFWHGCPKCYKAPNSNKKFWHNKKKINEHQKNLVKNKNNLEINCSLTNQLIPTHQIDPRIKKKLLQLSYGEVCAL